eukprot:7384272-Prymnesium_polylepis.1
MKSPVDGLLEVLEGGCGLPVLNALRPSPPAELGGRPRQQLELVELFPFPQHAPPAQAGQEVALAS